MDLYCFEARSSVVRESRTVVVLDAVWLAWARYGQGCGSRAGVGECFGAGADGDAEWADVSIGAVACQRLVIGSQR